MSRINAAVQRLSSRLKSRAGVSVVYTRQYGTAYEQSVPITAVPGVEQEPTSEPQGRGGRVESIDRDYLIFRSDLVIGGVVVEPIAGDRITETINGVACVFEVVVRDSLSPCFAYTDQTRQMLRVYTKQVS